jgi:cytoskeletal protein CcmA (bactofilin family)
MFGKSQSKTAEDHHRDSTSVQKMPRSAVVSSAAPEVSSISSGLSIVGKIVGHGAVTIFGQIEGELRASTVVIAEGAQMEGDVVAEELTVGGHVKGTIHANRVKLNSTAVVEGDIFHRTLSIEGMRDSRECRDARKIRSIRRPAYLTPSSCRPTTAARATGHLTVSMPEPTLTFWLSSSTVAPDVTLARAHPHAGVREKSLKIFARGGRP